MSKFIVLRTLRFGYLVLLVIVASCGNPDPDILGRWVADQTPAIAIYFYPDGTASISGTGFLKLEWKKIDDKLIRIDVLDKKIIFHFKLDRDSKGDRGTLELAGYDTFAFRRKD
jgi:hypothetical protein